MQGHTYAEAARLLNTAVGTVSTRLTQARNLLKHRLTRRGVVLPVAVLAILLEKNAAPAALPAQLPALALEGGKVAAGMGGSVSGHVAALTKVGLRGSRLLTPAMVAILAGLLAVMTAGLLVYRTFGPARNAGADDEAEQNWKQQFGREDQRFIAYSIHISPDEKLWAWQDGEFKIRVADLDTGNQLAAIQMPADAPNMSYPRFLGFTPDSRSVVCALSDVSIWDISTQKEVGRFPGGWVAAWGPDGKTIASPAGDGTIHLIDVALRRERVIEDRLPGPVTALAFHPDGKRLAASGRDGAIVFYDLETLQRQRRLPGNAEPTLELVFSADGSYLAALHGDPNAHPANSIRAVQVWQLDAETKIDLAPKHVTALAFVPHGRLLGIQEFSGALGTWDPVTGEPAVNLSGGGRGNTLLRLVFSPDGKQIVTRDARGNAFLRSVKTGKTVATLGHVGMVADAAFTSDGRRLATGTLRGTEDAQATEGRAEVKLWDRVP
jgi:hypothetical protein